MPIKNRASVALNRAHSYSIHFVKIVAHIFFPFHSFVTECEFFSFICISPHTHIRAHIQYMPIQSNGLHKKHGGAAGQQQQRRRQKSAQDNILICKPRFWFSVDVLIVYADQQLYICAYCNAFAKLRIFPDDSWFSFLYF